MSLTNDLSITPLQEENSQNISGESPTVIRVGTVRLLNKPLPFSAQRRNLLALLLFFATLAWFWNPLLALFSLTQQKEHYSHIVLIPFLSLYLFYLDRKVLCDSKEWSPWFGSFLMGMGACLYWSADAAIVSPDHMSMTVFALIVIWWGIFAFCFGIAPWRKVSFGLLFLLFMVPLPFLLLDVIIRFLQRSSAEAADLMFSTLGIPVFRQGFVFALSNFTIQVAEECSGIRSALALFITSLVAGHFFLRSPWTKMGLVAIVIPLAIVKNAFRIVGLALLANYVDPTFITNSTLHRSGGIPLFIVSLAVLFSLVWLFRRSERTFGYYPPD